MSIPFISNVAYTEVDSAGVLNDKAGTTKSKLPIQIFKLTDNITGNLTLNSSAIHKKIILDTNANTILVSATSPLTINSSIPLEIKGSGNIQSILKTFTSTESDTSYTGTTTIAAADDSTVLVGTNHTYTTDVTSFSGTADSFGKFGFMYNTTWAGYVGGNLMPNVNDATFRIQFNDAFPEDGGGGLIVGPGGGGQSSYTSNGGRVSPPREPSSNQVVDGYRTMVWENAGFDPRAGSNYTITMRVHDYYNYLYTTMSGASTNSYNPIANGVIPNAITSTGRKLTFTNNLAIPVVLSRTDPFAVTVAAGGTNVQTRNSTDGSFDILGTITGNDGSSQPYALKTVNDGSQSSLVTTAYSGTFSASAF